MHSVRFDLYLFLFVTGLLLIGEGKVVKDDDGSCGSKSSGPQDNPVQTLYGSSSYTWTTSIKWECVYNVNDYTGTDDERFNAAQSDAIGNGGGIVYFPTGSYTFENNLTLASNIVIRGAPTTAKAKNGKLPGDLNPSSIFNCPNKKHQGIWNFEKDATNLGIVNILLDQCAVMLWPSLITTSYSPILSMYWFAASDVAGMGSNKLVLSNLVRDVTYGTPLLGNTSNVWPWTFSTAIAVYSDKNSLVGNNLLSASLREENVTVTIGGVTENVPYPYDNRYGIDVNSILLGGVASSYCKGSGSKCGDASAFGGLYPSCAPFNFRTGLVIRDNWVAQNGRIGISFTGGNDDKQCTVPGSGTLVFNNHVEVRANTTCYSVDGKNAPRGSDTNENRGYDLSGHCSNVTLNSGHIHRQTIANTPYETVDGEGILHQSENGNWGYGDIIISNDLSGGSSGYIANWDLQWSNATTMKGNIVNPDQFIGVMLLNDDIIGPNWHCSENNPPAVFKYKSGDQPCPN